MEGLEGPSHGMSIAHMFQDIFSNCLLQESWNLKLTQTLEHNL